MSSPDPSAPQPARPPGVRAALAVLITAIEASIVAGALGGFRALLSHPPAMALIACWALSAWTLALLKPSRSRETVTREGESRVLLLLLGLIPLAVAPLSAWSERSAWWALPVGDWLRWAGVAIAALGLGIRIAAMARLGSRFSPHLSVQPGHRLETRGLYARIRHPGYLGALLASLGAALTFASVAGAGLVLVMTALLYARAGREERMLEAHFGQAWRAYRQRTGAFLPRFGR